MCLGVTEFLPAGIAGSVKWNSDNITVLSRVVRVVYTGFIIFIIRVYDFGGPLWIGV